jgi:hypothetical protein
MFFRSLTAEGAEAFAEERRDFHVKARRIQKAEKKTAMTLKPIGYVCGKC